MYIKQIVLNNEVKLWQVKANEIRIDLTQNGLYESWKYHPNNTMKQMEGESQFDFRDRQAKALSQKVYDLFIEKLPPEKREEAILDKSATY